MLKNKKIIGLLVGVCILLCSIVILTTTSSKPQENQQQDNPITGEDKSGNENEDITDKTKEETSKVETKTESPDSNKSKAETSNSTKNTQTTSTEEKVPSQDANQTQNTPSTPENTSQYVYVSIDCKTILNNMNALPEQYKQYVPSNGVILSSKKVKINDGDTVFDIITKVTKMNKISLTQSAGYIQSINNLPEKLFKGSGGWMYGVNGSYADKGSKEYKLKNNDKVQWRYTCYVGDLY